MRNCPKCGAQYSDDLAYCPNDGTATTLVVASGSPADPLIGSTIDGRYRIESKLGEGGMGVVYRASHVVLKKALAIKVMRSEQAQDGEVVQRFVQEAQSSSAIGHANIIGISDFGTTGDGSVYFAMEFLEGQTLGKAMEQGPLPSERAIGIFLQITSALEAAHQRGIVHRDLKPDNIFLVKRGNQNDFVKILDFGIAKVKNAAAKITRTGMVFGTPHYMSPEQAAGQAVDHRSDIYSLGVIM
ncbi:MAG TPA: serine/threonine-protein kinase, partial [Polyangiales bacterium]|nr:serine/threonine-protein kinase [Polyangiales bacterium]